MSKKLISIFVVIVSVLLISVSAFARTPLINDEYGVLTESEISKLSQKADAISSTYGIDTGVYFTDSFRGMNDGLFADNYWRNSGFSKNCSLLIVAIEDRSYYMYNCGDASKAITDFGSNYIDQKVVSYLSDDDWYKAAMQYLNFNSEFYDKYYSSGSAYDINDRPNELKMLLIQVFGCTGIGFAISLLVLSGKRREMKSVVRDDSANNYTSFADFNLLHKDDRFVDKHVVVSPLPKNDDHHDGPPGGGTTMHSGFSGHSFSGHGGKF